MHSFTHPSSKHKLIHIENVSLNDTLSGFDHSVMRSESKLVVGDFKPIRLTGKLPESPSNIDAASYTSGLGPDHVVPIANVTKKIDQWSSLLLGDENEEFILDGIRHGFCIVDNLEKPKSFKRSNYKSTGFENKLKVENRILEEVEKGNYIRTKVRPNNISSLGAIPKDLCDVRLIHDLSRPDGGINSLAWNTSVEYTSVDRVTSLIKSTGYLATSSKTPYRQFRQGRAKLVQLR
jgi:hypothetical protein